jgi:hypothetical protein
MCHSAFSMGVEGHIIADLMICHNFQRQPWIKRKLGQNGGQEHHSLREGQGRGFFFMLSMLRTTKKWARITRVR